MSILPYPENPLNTDYENIIAMKDAEIAALKNEVARLKKAQALDQNYFLLCRHCEGHTHIKVPIGSLDGTEFTCPDCEGVNLLRILCYTNGAYFYPKLREPQNP